MGLDGSNGSRFCLVRSGIGSVLRVSTRGLGASGGVSRFYFLIYMEVICQSKFYDEKSIYNY